jgi:PucR-like helix-turn-helix protein/diguanylate cyclase with GGDEF domain
VGVAVGMYDRSDRAVIQNAVRRLMGRLPQLADRLMAEILDGDGKERPPPLSEDLWEACHTGLAHGMEAILDPGPRRVDLVWAERLGRRRAQQGLPLDQLLRSYRIAGRVFWEGLVEIVNEDDPDHMPMLVRNATRTWHTIDQQCSAAAEAYHRTEYELLRRSEERVQAVVDALLEGRGAEHALLPTVTRLLGLPAQGRYAVVILSQRGALECPEFRRPPDAGGLRFIWRMRADALVGLVSLGTTSLDELVEVLRPRVKSHVGISAVVGALADLGKARWQAELALLTCRAEEEAELARLDRRLPEALVISQPELAGHLAQDVLGAMADVEPAYRTILLSTLSTWLECDGSARAAASRLYCHHNTVLNRLRRVETLTGRSLSNPRQLVELVLALGAWRLT